MGESFPGGADIPFFRPDVAEEDFAAVTGVLRRGWLTTGVEAEAFEAELAGLLGAPYVVAMSSCTAALETAFAFLDLPLGARVGVPTWTYAASALAAARFGATPVLLDVEPDTLNLSPEALGAALAQPGLEAVVAVHLGGVPVDAAVHEQCRRAGVPVVEDQAHAIGATDDRGLVSGQGSVAACLSFYATKNVPAGEGGALVTGDSKLARFARRYRLHGVSRDAWSRRHPDDPSGYDVVEAGIKGNLPDLLAALGRSQLRRFADHQARRRALVGRYRESLGRIDGLQVVPAARAEGSADHLMMVLLPDGRDRTRVRKALGRAGIGTAVHYPPLHQMTWFGHHAEIGPAGVATAERLAPRSLSLPLFPGLADDDVDRVVDALRETVG